MEKNMFVECLLNDKLGFGNKKNKVKELKKKLRSQQAEIVSLKTSLWYKEKGNSKW